VLSIRLRLTLWYTLMLAATVVALGAALYFLLSRTLASAADSDVSTTSLSVAQALITRTDPTTGELDVVLPEFAVLGDADTFVQVTDVRLSQVLARSANLGQRQLPPPPEPFPTTRQSGGAYHTVEDDYGRLRIFSRPVLVDGQVIALVQAARSLTADDRLFERLRLLLVVIGGIGLPATALIGWALAGRALAPIELAQRASSQANLGLAEANARLEQSLAVQKRFVADASHELRTPLTTIRANADVLRWMSSGDVADQQALADITSEAERMSRLVEGLLTLARADAGQRLPLLPIALRPLVEEVYRSAVHLASGQRLALEIDGDPIVRGNADAVRALLLILVDNAIKYTSSGQRVSVDVKLLPGEQVQLSVTDTGIGIPTDELGRVFEPFYRADSARETDGNGLGLAIARSIVQQHAGQIRVVSQPGQGSTFTVVLPSLASPPDPTAPGVAPVGAAARLP
jgi:two-component system OmpR family sensor kinase